MTRSITLPPDPRALMLPDHVTIEETVDGRWMVLVNGFQWGFQFDASGAGNATYATPELAAAAWRDR